jgi:hypothetical protein
VAIPRAPGVFRNVADATVVGRDIAPAGDAPGRGHERGNIDVVVIVENVATVIHVLAMAPGLATVMTTDVTLLRRLNEPFREVDVVALERAHTRVFGASAELRVSGLVLPALRAGLRAAAISAKRAVKHVVVGVLTLVAGAVARWAIPTLLRDTGRRITALGLPRRLALGGLAGLSAGSWSFALVLGGAPVLKTADRDLLHASAVTLVGDAAAVGVGRLAAVGRRRRANLPA